MTAVKGGAGDPDVIITGVEPCAGDPKAEETLTAKVQRESIPSRPEGLVINSKVKGIDHQHSELLCSIICRSFQSKLEVFPANICPLVF